MDLRNLLGFLLLWLGCHAQWEIRQYAEAIAGIVEQRFPITWQAFLDYRLNAVTLSDMDQYSLSSMLRGEEPQRHYRHSDREWQAFLSRWVL